VLDREVTRVNRVRLDCRAQLETLDTADSVVIRATRACVVCREQLELSVPPDERDTPVRLDRVEHVDLQDCLETPDQQDYQVMPVIVVLPACWVILVILVRLDFLVPLDSRDLGVIPATEGSMVPWVRQANKDCVVSVEIPGWLGHRDLLELLDDAVSL